MAQLQRWTVLGIIAAAMVLEIGHAEQTPVKAASPSSASSAVQVASPEALFRLYKEAVEHDDWDSVTRLMHPEALAEFKRVFGSMVAHGQYAREGLGLSKEEDLDTMVPEEFFRRLMRNKTGDQAFSSMFKFSMVSVLGTVKESDDLMHLVYRAQQQVVGISRLRVSVFTAKRYEGGWRILQGP